MMVEDIISSPWLAFGPSIFAHFVRKKQKQEAAAGNVPHPPSLARAGGRAVRHRSVASLPQSYVRGYWLRATRVHVARARPESRGVPR